MEGWELATIAFVVLAFATVARRLESSVVTPAIFFTSAGLLAGPVLGLIDLQIHGEPVKLLAEATLTLVLFADASRISLPALRNEFAVPLRLLAIGEWPPMESVPAADHRWRTTRRELTR